MLGKWSVQVINTMKVLGDVKLRQEESGSKQNEVAILPSRSSPSSACLPETPLKSYTLILRDTGS